MLFVCVNLLVCYRVPEGYIQLRQNVTPVRDPQTGTACPNFWYIPLKSDKLRLAYDFTFRDQNGR